MRPFEVDTINTEVVWCRKRRNSNHYYAGIRFTDTPDIIEKSWANFVLGSFGITEGPFRQKRKLLRVPSNIPVTCHYGEYTFTCGIIADIGLGGLKMKLNIDPGRGKAVALRVGPYNMIPALDCRATVMRSPFNISTNKFEVGVQFNDLNNRQVKRLGKYILTILHQSKI